MPKLSLHLLFSLLLLVSAPKGALADSKTDTEALMEQMQRDREALLEATEKAHQQLTNPSAAQSAKTEAAVKDMFNIDEMLAPYRERPSSETKEHLRAKLKGKPVVDNPTMINFLDALIRDERALKDVSGIISDKKKLGAFVVINILVFLIGMMFKKLHKAKNERASFGMRTFRFFWRFSIMTSIRIGVLIYFFGANLSRTWSIFTTHFF